MTLSDYNKCVQEFSDGIFRFLLSLCKDTAVAEDLCQDVFEKAWIKKDNIEMPRAKSYLFQMAHNGFIDHYRRIKPSQEIHENHSSYSTGEDWDLQHWLHQGLDQLKPLQKEAILLRDYEGYPYEEIGEILSISLSQVKVEIFRGRKKLKAFLGSKEVLV